MSVWDALTTRQIARILFTVAALSALLYLLVQVRSTLLLLGIAIFLAVALGPAVDFFARRGLPRAGAILVVYLMIFFVFGGVLSLIVPPVVNGATDLSQDIPGYVTDLRDSKTIRDFDDKYDVTSKLQEEANKLPDKLGDAAGALQSIATGFVNAAFQMLTILTMTFFLLLDGRRIANFFITRFGRHREERLRDVAERIYKSTSGYVAGALTITSINGILTFIVLTILGVPFAVPLAVIMSFFGLIPLIGATIGGVLILIVTLFNDFPSDDDHLRRLPDPLPAGREQRPAAVHLQAHRQRAAARRDRRDPRGVVGPRRRRRARRDPDRRGAADRAQGVLRRQDPHLGHGAHARRPPAPGRAAAGGSAGVAASSSAPAAPVGAVVVAPAEAQARLIRRAPRC